MYQGEYKIIRDNVHGYIKVPLDFVSYFLDTDHFQRLRNIEQTGMRTLYPAARHDRFIHSLGTFHLGSKAVFNFRSNVKARFSSETVWEKNHYKVLKDSSLNDKFWDKCETLFLIACLLHDCGHAPFSHSLEFFYEYDKDASAEMYTVLQKKMFELFSSESFRKDYDSNQGTSHERMSTIVIASEYADAVSEIIDHRGLCLSEQDTSLCDVDDDLEFIARMIIGCQYKNSNTKATRIKNCFINLLNSSSIDMDSLDYIIRDSHQSGIDNVSVDVERLLSALTLIEKTTFTSKDFSNSEINANIVESSVLSKTSHTCSLNGHLIGAATLEWFSAKLSGYIDIEGVFRVVKGSEFSDNTQGKFIVNGSSQDRINIVDTAQIKIIGTPKEKIEISGEKASTHVDLNSSVNLEANHIKFGSTYFSGKITGIFDGTILGDYSHLGGELTCELGFHKSALNVLQNVLLARNYEYLWIYGHHKVVYYANYLIIELVRESIKSILSFSDSKVHRDKVISQIFSIQSMLKDNESLPQVYDFCGMPISIANDSDINAIFKRCYLLCIQNKKFESAHKLLTEYYTRKYRSSVWKSLAEFNIFFNDLTAEEKFSLTDLFKRNGKDGLTGKYGCFPEWQRNFSKFGMDDVVWVDGDSNLKFLDVDKTYILFKNSTILNFRTAMQSGSFQSSLKTSLLYLYYRANPNVPFNPSAFREFIKEKLRETNT